MRRRWVIVTILGVIVSMIAGGKTPSGHRVSTAVCGVYSSDSAVPLLPDSLHTDTLAVDTVLDSLQLAIERHNRLVDDSIRLDSINRARSNGIEAPVKFSAKDSLVFDATTKTAHLYGSSEVDYQNMNLKSEKVYMSMDSNIIHATGVADSTAKGGLKGTPQFKWGSDEYVSDTIKFNFKTKKGIISNVYSEQEDGFLRSERSKRTDDGTLYLQHGRYTTCDEEHPDFYIALSRAKVRPGKDVVFGPAYLVVADVPLPLAIPYGFFPFTKSYSSGFIMPTYGDETSRGFYLRDGGYYFAISDRWDLKLLGEIYTKGSWGLSAASNYVKRYRYNGSFYVSYQNSQSGDKGLPDFKKEESFKIQWSHNQDAKANPYRSFKASVNFATSSYESNNLNGMYNPQALTQSTRTSSVSWGTKFSSLGLSLNLSTNITQNMRDTTLAIDLPIMTLSLSRFYPFKRKYASGKARWYEKISIGYEGRMSNSINTKEDKVLHSNIIKDWNNGFQHQIPIKTEFTLFDYLNFNASFSFTDRMYTRKVNRSWDEVNQREICDTTNGFHNVYDWSLSLGVTTKIYGMWTPNPKILGKKIIAVRHVLTPNISFSYSPDFSESRYGSWDTYIKTDEKGEVTMVKYSPFQGFLYGTTRQGKVGSFNFDLSNNIEMKIRSDKDSTGVKKISIIDELGAHMSYNMADKERPWSDLDVRLRLKWWKNYTFNLNATFLTYAYDLDDNGRPYIGTHTEYSRGRFGRLQGLSQNISYTLTPEKIKKFFSGGDDEDEEEEEEAYDTGVETNIDDNIMRGQHAAKKKKKMGKADTDADGYMTFNMPWSLTFGYGISIRENTSGRFNTKTMRYPYKVTQTLNVGGNIRLSDGWNIQFSSGYDFENHALSMTRASLSRDLHCFNMSCSVVLTPYTSYNFSFRCNAATLTDALKYDKRSSYSNAVQWY